LVFSIRGYDLAEMLGPIFGDKSESSEHH